MRMKPKMLLGSTALALVAVVLTTIGIMFITNDKATQTIQAEVRDRLIVLRDTQKNRVEAYFRQINTEVSQQATIGGAYTQALLEFKKAFPKFSKQVSGKNSIYRANVSNYYDEQFGKQYKTVNSEQTFIEAEAVLAKMNKNSLALQNYFIAQNPYPLGSKEELVALDVNTDYSRIHAKFHPGFREFLQRFGFYDVFLVDADTGNLIYSVFKELDFATSLIDGPYANSGIGEAFRLALTATEPGQTFTTDMKAYYPSYSDFASFISAPIFVNDKIEGVFIIQVPADTINELMTFNRQWAQYGLGESGETYIVADDKTIRNNSRFLKEDSNGFFNALKQTAIPETITDSIRKKDSTIGLMTVDTEGVNQALNGTSGFDIFADYRNIPVLSAYTPLNINGLHWALFAEIDEAEAFAPIRQLMTSIIKTALIVGIIVLLLGIIAALFFVKHIVSPITHFKNIMLRFTKGEKDVRVKLNSDDEIGELARTFDKLLDERENVQNKFQAESDALNNSIINMLQVAAQLSQGDLTVKMEVAEDVTGTLSDSLNMVIEQTNRLINQVKGTATNVQRAAKQVQTQSETSKQVAGKELQVVNAAAKDLTEASNALNNIVKLARKCNQTAGQTITITDNAQKSVTASVDGINNIRDNIRETEKRIKRLGERSQEIGSVIELINGIAEKTHVLALNASMQAASAGEAGRGFAVVANEVQRLAENAREATQEISQQVKNIQADTADTMAAMNNAISKVVEGSQLAKKSGQIMHTTREKSHELATLVQQIAERSEMQAKVAWNLQKQATELRKSNAQTFSQMNEQTQQTEKLVSYSVLLQKAINNFKIIDSQKQSNKAVNS